MMERYPGEASEEVRLATAEDLPEAIRFIKASSTRMDRLIAAILRLSREGQRPLAPELLDLGALLGGLVDSVRHQAAERGTEVDVGPMPAIVADRVALEQIFGNLLDNAMKYLAPARRPASRSRAARCRVRRRIASRSAWATTGAASRRGTWSASSSCSVAPAARTSPARASDWPMCVPLFAAWAAASIVSRPWMWDQSSA